MSEGGDRLPRARAGEEHRGFADQSRELMSDLAGLLEAEIREIRKELSKVWRGLGWVAGLAGAAIFLLFWVVALAGATLTLVVARWLPLWAAALSVLLFFLLVAAVLLAIAWSRVKRMDNPVDIVFRRLQDHLDWWRSDVHFRPQEPAPGTGDPVERGSEP